MNRTSITTVSGASQADIPLPAGFNNGLILFKLTVSADDTEIRMRVTDDDFTTVEQGASDYNYVDARASISSKGEDGSTGASYLRFTSGTGNAAGEGAWGTIDFAAVADAAFPSSFGFNLGSIFNNGNFLRRFGGGSYMVSSVINGVRFYPSSGNISGEFRVYSLAES